MTANKNSSGKYRRVDPDEYFNFEEQFREKNTAGSGGKGSAGKGRKTLQDLKRQQQVGSLRQRREELEDALLSVVDGFPEFDSDDKETQFLEEYVAWVAANLSQINPLDPSQVEITFSKSGGPGGQNVNKRETKVALRHKPTRLRVVNDQTRSQADNRKLAEKQLQKQLENHLRDWKMYLGSGQQVNIWLIKELLKREI